MATKSTPVPQFPAVTTSKALQVTARAPSFWRAGLQFTHAPRTVPLADLTEDQAQAIRDEGRPGGMLVVTELDDLPAQGT